MISSHYCFQLLETLKVHPSQTVGFKYQRWFEIHPTYVEGGEILVHMPEEEEGGGGGGGAVRDAGWRIKICFLCVCNTPSASETLIIFLSQGF